MTNEDLDKLSPEGNLFRWDQWIDHPYAGKSVDDLEKTVQAVMQVLVDQGPSGIEFKDHLPGLVNAVHLAVALRATFSFRDQIPTWSIGLKVAKAACLWWHLDQSDVLFGMLNEK